MHTRSLNAVRLPGTYEVGKQSRGIESGREREGESEIRERKKEKERDGG